MGSKGVTRLREPSLPRVDLVAIGASSGGLKALKALLAGLPVDTGAAFVVVVHLDPTRPSELAKILREWTAMPVVPVSERTKLSADTVYVIAPNRALSLSGDAIAASPFKTPRGHRAPIDMFFRAISELPNAGTVIVLSGAGSDGAVGVAAVRERGGLVLAQDPEDAEFPSMPRAAIAVGVDAVLSADRLGPRIGELVQARNRVGDSSLGAEPDFLLKRIFARIKERSGHDFSQYKRPTILRRIARRMQITQTIDLETYAERLGTDPVECQALFRDLLISVTRFFRDPAAFEALRTQALAPLFETEKAEPPNTATPNTGPPNAGPPNAGPSVRVWVVACATGEEAYSIAILLLEEAEKRGVPPAIQIFATDLDEEALAVARAGRYPSAIEADVSEDRLARFFTPVENGYQIKRQVRDCIIFTAHDVLCDPPFMRLDLVTCRNLLIYFGRSLQAQACETFSYALRPGGHLFLGASETADFENRAFEPIDREARLYRVLSRPRATLPALPRVGAVADRGIDQALPARPRATAGPGEAHRMALEAAAPPSILIDEAGRIAHVSETAGRFLMHPGGAVTIDAGDLVRPELALDLRAALHRTFEHGERTVTLPVPVLLDGALVSVVLSVRPAVAESGAPAALVLFMEGGPVDPATVEDMAAGEQGALASKLREELTATRTLLRVSREQYEEATDELRASNEELQSVNEEYRATAEELETSKEELQSINEELQTVNSELTIRLEMVSRANNDLLNLMAATDIATLFLDSQLRIKRFTPRITGLFSLVAGDEGRPLADFSHHLIYPELISDASQVLKNLDAIERRVDSTDGRHFTTRLRPYRTADDRIEGVVVTFFDITEKHNAEVAFAERQRMLLSEMVHRVKNTLAVVNSLVRRSLHGTPTPKSVVDELSGRLQSLARSHDLLLQTEWRGAALADLVATQVLAHADKPQIRTHGPAVMVASDSATPLGLILHELVTNALKYGSLSAPAGFVDISWREEGQGIQSMIVLEWRESGGPVVTKPTQSGKGIALINSCLSRGSVALAFEPSGAKAKIIVPSAG